MNIDIDRLLDSACPSIQYRIRKEILCRSTSLPEMSKLQDQILRDEAVQAVIQSQSPDGWLAWNFHGYGSMESGMRLLCEKGVEADRPVLRRALLALETQADYLGRGVGKFGRVFDERGFGGAELIRAHLFAHAGKEEDHLVQKQIEELYQPYRGKLVFREGVCWPSIYHLRLLALSQSWRTPENHRLIVKAIRQIVRRSPLPNIYVKYRSQLIAPASFCMDDFHPDMSQLTDTGWMLWFHRMELLARLGIVGEIPELKRQVHFLAKILEEGQGLFARKLSHVYFHKWGSYTGLALEKDWRLPQRRINDLTFRSLLILHHSK
jgi:hypothetical protein